MESGPRCGAEKVVGELDLESLIQEFLADDSRSTLGLPHMTTGQRKQTKKLVEQHPGLRCESFGLGQERQLHLFKASDGAAGAPSSAAVAPAAAVISPQKPAPLSLPSAGGSAGNTPERAGVEQQWETATTACSTSASTMGSPGTSPRGSAILRHFGVGKPPGLATPLGVAAVRNTFIHFDFEGSKEDDRQVQSLPHGMFRQRLWAEAHSEGVAEEAPQPPSLPPAVEDTAPAVAAEQSALPEAVAPHDALLPGTEVEIRGLSRCPAFNGRRAVVQSYDRESGRYDVVLCSAGEQRAKVRRENLGPAAPMMPPAAAPLAAAPAAPLLATPSPTGTHVQAR